MEFALTEEQQELAATLRSLLAKRADSGAVRARWRASRGYDEALWTTLCEQIGVAALGIPEEYDGAGASLFESLSCSRRSAGRSRPPRCSPARSPPRPCSAGADEQRAELLPRIAAGEVATFVIEPPLVLEPAAEIVLVPRGDALSVADDRPEARPALDQTLRLGHLDTDAEPSRPLRDVAAALATALQVGAAQRGLDMTVAYAKERVQFGRPIGSFQALKHRMADMLVLVEMARSASWAASSPPRRTSPSRPTSAQSHCTCGRRREGLLLRRAGEDRRRDRPAARRHRDHLGARRPPGLQARARPRPAVRPGARAPGLAHPLIPLSAPPPTAGPVRGPPPARPATPACSAPKPSSTVSAGPDRRREQVWPTARSVPVSGELPGGGAAMVHGPSPVSKPSLSTTAPSTTRRVSSTNDARAAGGRVGHVGDRRPRPACRRRPDRSNDASCQPSELAGHRVPRAGACRWQCTGRPSVR